MVHSSQVLADGVVVQREDLLLVPVQLDQSLAPVPVALENATNLKNQRKEYDVDCRRLNLQFRCFIASAPDECDSSRPLTCPRCWPRTTMMASESFFGTMVSNMDCFTSAIKHDSGVNNMLTVTPVGGPQRRGKLTIQQLSLFSSTKTGGGRQDILHTHLKGKSHRVSIRV